MVGLAPVDLEGAVELFEDEDADEPGDAPLMHGDVGDIGADVDQYLRRALVLTA